MNKRSDISRSFLLLVAITIIVSLLLVSSSHIGFSWLIVIVATIYTLWQVWKQGRFWWEGRNNAVAKRERVLRVLASMMGLFLATGTALFLWAFYHEHTDDKVNPYLFVNAEYLLRSIVCSLDLFMLDIDSNVLDGIKGHEYVKGLISIQAVLSFSCTVAVLISLAYARVIAYYRLHKKTVIDNDHNHLYVFFEMNEASHLLAKSIREKEGDRAVIIIVEKSPVNDEDRGGWDSIVGMFTNKEQIFAEADELDARVTFTETRPCEIDKDKLPKTDMPHTDILESINLMSVKNLITRLANGVEDAQLHVFFLSENEDNNIRAASTLALDKTINESISNIMQRFYCHARMNSLNRVVEDIALKRGLEVRIVDSAHLAIEQLKLDEKNHPDRLVEVDDKNPTTVKSEFCGLVVGFDEAGQDALRFLYEFGAFVDSKASPEKERRSPFHCVAVDSNMLNLRGVFETFSPAAMEQTNEDGSKLIELRKCNFHSTRFFEKILKDIYQKLNYVIIAVGDEEQGMLLALRIFNYVRRERKDLSRFRIYVRSYNADKEEFMQKISNHYNEGYNVDCKDKDELKADEIIVPFGQKDKIYSYDMIVDDELAMKGKVFQEGYARMKHEPELWDTRRAVLTGVKKYEKDLFGRKNAVIVPKDKRTTSIDNLRSLRRKESQDKANALHAGTKLYLLRKTKADNYDWQNFLDRYFEVDGKTPQSDGKYDKINYPRLSTDENQAIINLARLEHLRWNASHEILGYRKANKDEHGCNEQSRRHNCLRPWQELDEESKIVTAQEGWDADYKSFDFGVVDITLLLYKDKLLAQKTEKKKGQ